MRYNVTWITAFILALIVITAGVHASETDGNTYIPISSDVSTYAITGPDVATILGNSQVTISGVNSTDTKYTITIDGVKYDQNSIKQVIDIQVNYTGQKSHVEPVPRITEYSEFSAVVKALFADEGQAMIDVVAGGTANVDLVLTEYSADTKTFKRKQIKEDGVLTGAEVWYINKTQNSITMASQFPMLVESAIRDQRRTSDTGFARTYFERLAELRDDYKTGLELAEAKWLQDLPQQLRDLNHNAAMAAKLIWSIPAFYSVGTDFLIALDGAVDYATGYDDAHWTSALGIVPYLRLPLRGVIKFGIGTVGGLTQQFLSFTGEQNQRFHAIVIELPDTAEDFLIKRLGKVVTEPIFDASTKIVACQGIFCFPKGTLVQTPRGLADIDSIQKGDSVLTWSESGDRVSVKPVLATRRTFKIGGLWRVTFEANDSQFVVEATAGHPFGVVAPDGGIDSTPSP